MTEICACCGEQFKCEPEYIAQCQCSKIRLTDNLISYISSKYQKCLCINCLLKIQTEFEMAPNSHTK